jgi:PAS domain S-box-containing protein
MQAEISIAELQDLLAQEKKERLKAEALLKEKEQELAKIKNRSNGNTIVAASDFRFDDLVNNLPGIVFQVQYTDGLFKYNYVSPVLHQNLGTTITHTGQVLKFIHPEDRQRWVDSLHETYQNRKKWKLEVRTLTSEGQIDWWICSAIPYIQPNGELVYNGILLNITNQKNIENRLQENERKWRFALEGSGDGLWEHDVATNSTYYSSTFKQMLGFDDDEYDNDNHFWRKCIHPDDLHLVEEMEAAYEASIAESHSVQYRARRKDGQYIWIMDRGFVLSRDAQGKPTHYIGVHTNISKIKQTEIELATTANKLSTLITTMQDGIMLENEHNVVQLCNEAFCRIFGIDLEPKNLINQNVNESLERNRDGFSDYEAYKYRREELLKNGVPATEEEFELSNGKYLSRDYAPLIIDGKCKGHLWKYTDITARKKAEKDLIEAERQYRNLIENMQVGLVETNEKEQIVYANHTYYSMSGYSEAELTGNIGDLIMLDTSALQTRRQNRRNGIGEFYEAEIKTKWGEKRWWYISVIPKSNDLGKVIGSVAAVLDITDQKRLETALRQAKLAAEESSKAKDIFLANMSHEIRTPMNAVFGMSRLLAKTRLEPQQQFYLETIMNATSSLMVIVNDILDFSKISVGKLTLEKIGFRIKDIISSSIDVVAYRAQEKGLLLQVIDEKSFEGVLIGDPFRLKQVLMNILTNAVKFTATGSVTVLSVDNGIKDGLRHITLRIKDTGRGMEEDFLKILFDKFTQEDESIARSYSGTGLGMSISKHLVDLMGGYISVESFKGVGTTFNLDFYFEEGTDADLEGEQAPPIETDALRNKRILLVEDNEMNQLVAKTILEQSAMKVTVATNGAEAVEFAKNHPYDMILMDMQMPIMDGLKATKVIRNTGIKTPIIALTANAVKGERDKCLEVGMDDFLAKPFEENVLLNLIFKWLGKESDQIVPAKPLPNIDTSYSIDLKKVTDYETPLFNLDQLKAISPGNDGFLKMVIGLFINDAQKCIEQFKEALNNKDFKTIKAVAHRIKPTIDQLSIPFSKEIRKIETLSIKGDNYHELTRLIGQFESLIQKIIPLLEKEID